MNDINIARLETLAARHIRRAKDFLAAKETAEARHHTKRAASLLDLAKHARLVRVCAQFTESR